MTAFAVEARPMPASLVERMLRQESAAATVFESRWTMRALRQVDPDLCQAVEEQRALFHEAILTGEDDAVREHGEAMCRGWAAATMRMEAAGAEDDAYMLGQDSKSGMVVAIATQRSASARVRELHGERVVFLTPDEVAAMFAGLQTVAAVKALWPGAEIEGIWMKPIERYPDEPAQEDC